MLETRQLQFSYKNGPLFHFPDINLEDGKDLLILGKSGVGKTTLLHVLALLLKPLNGTIIVDGTDLSKLSVRKSALYRGRQIGIVFQKPHFIKSLTVTEHIKAKLYLSKSPINGQKTERILEALDIKSSKNKQVTELSEGQKQRLSIAIALINKPSLILADEPSSALDDENCNQVVKLLKTTAEEAGAHLIVITHDQRVKPFFSKTLEL